MKKKLSLLLAAAMMLTALAGCGPKGTGSASSGSQSGSASESSSGTASSDVASGVPGESDAYDLPNFMVMTGPTGVGAAKLMYDDETLDLPEHIDATAQTTVVVENKEVTDALVNGTTDIAAIATNVAANLAAKTNGGIQVLAINNLGVLYILEKGDSVQSMADLKGKTVYAAGQGANPEYILNHLLTSNGVQPDEVDIQWMAAQEITAKMASEEAGICMLPVPAATALLLKDQGIREALSLSDEWDKLDQGPLPIGCIVARTDYIEENPQGVEVFLKAYEQSVAYMNDEANRADAAALVAKYGITPNDKIAAKAIPQCNLTFLTGDDMRATLEEYYQVLFQADPASIGGAMPYDSFYYGAN